MVLQFLLQSTITITTSVLPSLGITMEVNTKKRLPPSTPLLQQPKPKPKHLNRIIIMICIVIVVCVVLVNRLGGMLGQKELRLSVTDVAQVGRSSESIKDILYLCKLVR